VTTNRMLLAVAFIAALSGCGSTPSRVKLPEVIPSAAGDDRYVVATTKDVLGNNITSQTLKDAKSQRLPLEVSRQGVLAQVEAHEQVWFQAGVDLAHRREDLGNSQFGGAALSAIGVIAKSIDVGRVGAAAAGGLGVWDSHYQLEVQRNNYKRASQAARCARLKVEAIQPVFFTSYYYGSGAPDKMGMLRFSEELLEQNGLDGSGFDRLKNLYRHINTSLHDMRDALQSAQESVTLAAPSSSELVSALQQKADENEENKKRAAATTQTMQGALQRLVASDSTLRALNKNDISQLSPGEIGKLTAGDIQALVDRAVAARVGTTTALDSLPIDDPIAQAAASRVNSATLKQALDLKTDLDACVALLGSK
jgi:hypothetical protein